MKVPNLNALFDQQKAWSSATFGGAAERGPDGPLNHLLLEIAELEEDPSDLSEWADCLILAMDAAWRAHRELKLDKAAWRVDLVFAVFSRGSIPLVEHAARILLKHPQGQAPDWINYASLIDNIFSAAYSLGIWPKDLCEAVHRKQQINAGRDWLPPNEQGVCLHVKKNDSI